MRWIFVYTDSSAQIINLITVCMCVVCMCDGSWGDKEEVMASGEVHVDSLQTWKRRGIDKLTGGKE